mmetsp:Transcript_922/g.2344  ORF Transcript_922/g.2344 Transcript_922/m.2344 type:complete len:309 (+) Transcript_922:221-1147(+)|eukprot:CAMPEP_0172379300 /NCGR_PEP_ID=MMETSP1060-20121228/69861_1 /TAXON_ID=37318 /ORGANISM="Pseudo-nitzschia pungens, Strain cf. cingulata" /LENGTH=308 /DNA_ID=CAMNT_0013107037 /DNA_START=216 /DNA_END=1142 /DNA_ORIENTATION=-
MHRILTSTLLLAATVSAFAPSAQQQQRQAQHAVSTMPLQATKLAALPTVPNPFKSLPWNVEKAQKSQERKLKLERSKMHRELGIAQDATYEEIVEVTQRLIDDASDRKRKIQIEVMKDKILQARLNERLAGLVSDIVSDDAMAQGDESTLEGEKAIAELKDKKKPKEWNAPAWTQGLIVKPDQAHVKSQVQIWGIMSLMGLALPPFIQYANRFSWMVCVAQLSFRGMPKAEGGGGGFGVMRMGGGPGDKKHLKVAWLLGITITIVGAVVTYGFMPSWAKGHRMSPTIAFAMRNFIYGVTCSYLQPYKG